MSDPFAGRSIGLESPLIDLFPIAPDDAQDLEAVTRALYVGTPGTLRVTTAAGRVVDTPELPAGFHPLRIRRVHAAGTTASGLMGGI